MRMLLAVGLIAAPSPPAGQPGWEPVRMHSYGGCDSMTDIVPLSRTNVWVFGRTEPVDDECAGTAHPVAQHWDGRAWRTVGLPGRIYGEVGSAGASSPDNLWAFTASDTGESHALRFDGRRWMDAGRPAMGSRPNLSNGMVLGRHHVWAFGDSGGWFWNGRTWRHSRLPLTPVKTSVVSQKDVWAISCCAVAHFDGQVWRKVPLGAAIPAGTGDWSTSLTGVLAIAKDDVWVFGNRSETNAGNGRDQVVAAHYDGHTWSPVEVPLPAPAGTSADPWRLGDAVPDGRGGIRVIANPPGNAASRVLSRTAAGQWSTSIPQVAGKAVDLWDLALIPGTREVWAAGGVRQSERDSTSVVLALR
ncbi:hypothetical protein [Sphaerisporangium fuscum]|uniref:hypothetical protein n=1 Tax=Sphaerisporangium fuscum TaxID=2835868 RepID=UPI001BDC48EB|nr:hypothetical protein [Sphaerisporangium fuscum]